MKRFNSRTREGCDTESVKYLVDNLQFQFTHPGGVRLLVMLIFRAVKKFQFTHPGGVRLGLVGYQYDHQVFQFTHPGGVRRYPLAPRRRAEGVSIHAPGRGATTERSHSLTDIGVSIHAPGRGATTIT